MRRIPKLECQLKTWVSSLQRHENCGADDPDTRDRSVVFNGVAIYLDKSFLQLEGFP